MLLLKHPYRLSTDVDIIVKPGYNIDCYIKQASKLFPFRKMEENVRKGSNKIPKRHYKLFYPSTSNNEKDTVILIDVLFEINHYCKTEQKEIKTEFLAIEGQSLFVSVPSIDSILGDKLTAFAPKTIGIKPLTTIGDNLIVDKKVEVIKQFFDVACLFDSATSFDDIKRTYLATCSSEVKYRGLSLSYKDCLMDSFNSSLSILSRGKTNSEDYALFLEGIKKMPGFILREKFDGEQAY